VREFRRREREEEEDEEERHDEEALFALVLLVGPGKDERRDEEAEPREGADRHLPDVELERTVGLVDESLHAAEVVLDEELPEERLAVLDPHVDIPPRRNEDEDRETLEDPRLLEELTVLEEHLLHPPLLGEHAVVGRGEHPEEEYPARNYDRKQSLGEHRKTEKDIGDANEFLIVVPHPEVEKHDATVEKRDGRYVPHELLGYEVVEGSEHENERRDEGAGMVAVEEALHRPVDKQDAEDTVDGEGKPGRPLGRPEHGVEGKDHPEAEDRLAPEVVLAEVDRVEEPVPYAVLVGKHLYGDAPVVRLPLAE